MIQAAIELLSERDRRLAWLRAEIAIGDEHVRRDDVIPFTPELLDELTREAEEGVRNGDPVNVAAGPQDPAHQRCARRSRRGIDDLFGE